MSAMKTIALLVATAVSTTAAFGQKSGFFIDAGAGVAQMKTGDFAVFNPVASVPGQPLGEALPALDRTSRVSVARLTLGYAFNENWDLRLSYAGYGSGEVRLAFPTYPGIFFVTAPDQYERHVMSYDAAAFALLPVYTHALDDRLRLKIGAGLSASHTSAHIEATYSSGAILPRPAATAHSYAGASETSLGYILLLGVDCAISRHFSIGISADYGTMQAKVPASPWANRSRSSVPVTALGAELVATWRW